MSPLERERVPDAIRWARFRGLGRLGRVRVTPVLASNAIALHFYRNAYLLTDILRRLLT